MTDRPKSSERLTTVTGAPIAVQQALTASPRGPVLMEDVLCRSAKDALTHRK